MSHVMIVIVFLALQLGAIQGDDSCRFETSRGVIDLSSLARDDGKAAYTDLVPQQGSTYKYSYNPCRPFSEGSSCQNVAACQVSNDGKFTYSLGGQETATWNDGSSFGIDPSISYTINQKVARVTLECVMNGTGEFEAVGETAVNVFGFRLRHKCACWDACKNPPDTTTTKGSSTTTTEDPKNTTTTTKKPSSTATHPTETKTAGTTTTPIPSTTDTSTAGDGNMIGWRRVLITILLLVCSKIFIAY